MRPQRPTCSRRAGKRRGTFHLSRQARRPPGALPRGLLARDVALGLGRGGAVLAAAEAAARADDAPAEGVATLDVLVGAAGPVVVAVADTDGDRAGWERVAGAIARSVDPRRVRLPPGARGLRVMVRVEAHRTLSDGRDVRSLHGPRRSLEQSVLSKTLEGKAAPRPVSPAPAAGGELGNGSAPDVGAAVGQGMAQRVLPSPTLSTSPQDLQRLGRGDPGRAERVRCL